MTDFKIDEEFEDDIDEQVEEVNTTYDQNQTIGDEPQALNTELSGAEPIDAMTGQDFYDIQKGGQAPRVTEYQNVWKIISGETLNKDGTGVASARRGIDPNNIKHEVMKFDYVSQSGCDICAPYDGMTFARDSPNRPVIPRLESGGEGRPYTHPNCKCRWTKVFTGGEYEMKDPIPFARAVKLESELEIKKEADEGGRGSGKNGHQRWMLGAEVGEECESCMMITEYKDGKCMVCGN